MARRRYASDLASRQNKGSSVITIAVLTGLLIFVLFAMSRTGDVVSRILFQGIAPNEGSAP
jgi:hypothetical protein